MVSNPRPLNVETRYEYGVVNDLKDPIQQHRVRISPASLASVQAEQLPWFKAQSNHSQLTSKQGQTMESAHSLKRGDIVLLRRDTASEQDWHLSGHVGSIIDGQQGGSTGSQNFYYHDIKTGNTQTGKPKTIQTTYPTNPTYNNPGQVQTQLAQDPDVRKYFQTKLGKYNQLSQPQQWANGYHIIQNQSKGSPITQVILNEDQSFMAEAQKDNKALQMLHRLRSEGNTQDFNGFVPNSQIGLIHTFQNLLSGGGLSGLNQSGSGGSGGSGGGNNQNNGSNLPGMGENLLQAFNDIGQQVIQTGVQQNSAFANGQFLDETGTALHPMNVSQGPSVT